MATRPVDGRFTRRHHRHREGEGAPPCPRRPPQAPPPPHRSCRRAPDIALRRQLPRAPHPAPVPPCARVPPARHAQPSAEPVGGSQLPSPAPSRRGAAAPSSPLRTAGEASDCSRKFISRPAMPRQSPPVEIRGVTNPGESTLDTVYESCVVCLNE